MANVNSGGWQRFENGTTILVGSDTVLNVVPGSYRRRVVQRERVQNIDRGVLGAVTVGDERAQEIEFAVYRTSTLNTLLATLRPAATNGLETFLTLTFKQPTYLGAATGDQWVFNRCYMPDGEEEQGSDSGQSADQVTLRFLHSGAPVTPTTY